MSVTLAEALKDERVPFAELQHRYRPVLGLVEVLIGVVPNCDRYLEIWPPGFRTYNLHVRLLPGGELCLLLGAHLFLRTGSGFEPGGGHRAVPDSRGGCGGSPGRRRCRPCRTTTARTWGRG